MTARQFTDLQQAMAFAAEDPSRSVVQYGPGAVARPPGRLPDTGGQSPETVVIRWADTVKVTALTYRHVLRGDEFQGDVPMTAALALAVATEAVKAGEFLADRIKATGLMVATARGWFLEWDNVYGNCGFTAALQRATPPAPDTTYALHKDGVCVGQITAARIADEVGEGHERAVYRVWPGGTPGGGWAERCPTGQNHLDLWCRGEFESDPTEVGRAQVAAALVEYHAARAACGNLPA